MEDFDRINNEFYDANADRFDKIPFSELLPKLLLKYPCKSRGWHLSFKKRASPLSALSKEKAKGLKILPIREKNAILPSIQKRTLNGC